jgi:hypothetical protein
MLSFSDIPTVHEIAPLILRVANFDASRGGASIILLSDEAQALKKQKKTNIPISLISFCMKIS